MSGRLALLALVSAATGLGQYVYEPPDDSRWVWNGTAATTVTYTPTTTYELAFPGAGGSFMSRTPIAGMSRTPIAGPNPNDYEVKSSLGLKAGGGTYIQFVRADSALVQPGAGSYLSAEIAMPAAFSGTGIATLNLNQCVSGTVTQLAST